TSKKRPCGATNVHLELKTRKPYQMDEDLISTIHWELNTTLCQFFERKKLEYITHELSSTMKGCNPGGNTIKTSFSHYKSTLERKRYLTNDLDKSILNGIKDEEIKAEIEEALKFTDAINLTLIALKEAKISKGNEGKNVENASQHEVEKEEITTHRIFQSVSSGNFCACTMKNHISNTSRSRTRCGECQGRLYTSICSQGKETRTQEMKSVELQTVERGGNNRAENSSKQDPRNKDIAAPEESLKMCVNTKNAVLLQTAKGRIYRPDMPHRKHKARIFLDGRRHRTRKSHVTEKVRNEINLVISHSESLAIKSFGSSGGTAQVCDIVDLCISVDGDYDVKLSAISVPLISAPVQGQYLKHAVKSYPYLPNLQLADDCEGHSPTDVIVGTDQYWNLAIVTGEWPEENLDQLLYIQS
ncbi:Hypothetical predicted protein, partial [Paramuricea clavata]